MNKDHILLSILWTLYCSIHSILANTKVKVWIRSLLRFTQNGYRLFYNVFAFLSLGILIYYHLTVESYIVFYFSFWNYAAGILLITFGLIIMVICIIKYFRQMAGISAIGKKEVLQVSGLHRYIRHPLYAGTFLFLIGLFCMFPLMTNLLAVMIIIIYTIIGIHFEEMKLISQFGDQYVSYRKKVPMIIPRLK